jgi:hypothetical protein
MKTKRIVLIAILGVLASSGSVFAQDDFTFTIPINVQKLTPNVKKIAVAVFLFDDPAEPAGRGYGNEQSPSDPRQAGGRSVARSVTEIPVPPSGSIRQTVIARFNVAKPETIESYSVVGYVYANTPPAGPLSNFPTVWTACDDNQCTPWARQGSATMFHTGDL